MIPLLMNTKQNFFGNTFLMSTIFEWNKSDPAIRNSASFNFFKESILKFIRPAPKSIFQCQNHKGIKHLTQLLVNFHLRHHKFKHSFQETINPLCICSLEAETRNHFILHCLHYENNGHVLLASICSIKSSILDRNDNNILKTLLDGLNLTSIIKSNLNQGFLKNIHVYKMFIEIFILILIFCCC